MDYKAIIEGQIKTLQEVQIMDANECCEVARVIIQLCLEHLGYEQYEQKESKEAK